MTYVDATNLTPHERRPYVKMARQFEADIEAVFFDVPASECIRRNSGRGRVVPAEVIEKLSKRLVAPRVSEGFSRVTVIR